MLLRRVVVAAAPGRFLAWPANNGLWSWEGGREILARSRDGCLTWQQETPVPYVGSEGPARPLAVPLRLDDPDLAIRVVADGRGTADDRLGRFFASVDRGRNWQGPFLFTGLERAPELRGLILTSRTAVRSTGPASAQVLLSARDPALGRHSNRFDKTFLADTREGGRTWRVVSWLVPKRDPYRAVMPALVDLGDG